MTVTIGAVTMACGHFFLMAFEMPFLLALLCLLIGVGFFKGNIASQSAPCTSPAMRDQSASDYQPTTCRV